MTDNRAREKTNDEVGGSPLRHACREGNLQDVLDVLKQCGVEQVNAREGEQMGHHPSTLRVDTDTWTS